MSKLDLVIDLSHSEHCFEWDRCDDCYEDMIQNHNRLQIEPVINEQYDRPILETGAGYNIGDRKSSDLLDMIDNIQEVFDSYLIMKHQVICKVCNLMYYSRLGFCPNC